MLYRLQGVVLGVCLALVKPSIAQSCASLDLYTGASGDAPSMPSEGRTWPEGPEYFTNWGNKPNMPTPYIRLSGQKNVTSDWVGTLTFAKLPAKIEGGSLRFFAHAQQSTATLSVRLVTTQGLSQARSFSLTPGVTVEALIALDQVGITLPATLSAVQLQLDQVPANTYHHMLFDGFSLDCATAPDQPGDDSTTIPTEQEIHPAIAFAEQWQGSDVDPTKAARPMPDLEYIPDYIAVTQSEATLTYRRERSQTGIVINAIVEENLREDLAATPLDAKASSRKWFLMLSRLVAGRLRDSVIANPQTLHVMADALAASYNHYVVPILLADVDYEAMVCDQALVDDSQGPLPDCAALGLEAKRLLVASLPVAKVTGSRITFVLDPMFFTTNRTGDAPTVQVGAGNQWTTINMGEAVTIDLPMAGVNLLRLRVVRGGQTSEQIVKVEVN